MTLHERARDYFTLHCGEDDFWHWGPDARTLLWADGSIFASRGELVCILRHLEATGLPPIGAIAHMVAAVRGKTVKITWLEPSENQRCSERFPCHLESSGKVVSQDLRVRYFSTPESISMAAMRLAYLPNELGELLDDPRVLPELAELLLSGSEQPVLSEGIITLFASAQLTGDELNHPRCHSKYPRVLEDLALLAKSFEKLPPGELHSQLNVRLARVKRSAEARPVPAWLPP